MKKYLFAIFAFTIALGVFAQVLPSFASGVYLPVQGGTGTSSTPQSGEILIGNGSGTYTPAYIVCTGNCSTATSSGGLTINVTGSGGGSSTVLYAGPYIMLNASGSNGYVVSNIGVLSLVSSSDIGVSNATGTGISFSFLNPKGFSTTTIQSVLNALSGTGLASYNSSTGVFSVSSSSLNLGTASHYSFSDFLPSSTAYVSSFNTRTGAVTLTSADVTTALGYTPLSGNQTITIIATGDATGTASGATTITHNLTITGLEGKALPSLATGTLRYTGGAWTFDGNTYLLSGVNVTTTAPLSGGGPLTSAGLILTCSSCLTGNQTITLTGAVTGSGATSIATTYTTSTLYGFFSATGPIVYSSATGAFSWTNSNNYISSISINGNAGTSFTVGAGSGITSTVAGTATTLTLNLNATCSGNQFLTGVSATGTGSCGTPSGGASSTNVYGISPIVVNQVGVNASTSCPTCAYGTGTANYIPLFLGTQQVTSSAIVQSSTNIIGINTPTPDTYYPGNAKPTLEVNGITQVDNSLSLYNQAGNQSIYGDNGGWQFGMDTAATVPYADYYLARNNDIRGSSVEDFFYIQNNNPTSTLAASTTIGATTITLSNALTVSSTAPILLGAISTNNQEQCTPTTALTSSTITCSSPLVYAHNNGTLISEMGDLASEPDANFGGDTGDTNMRLNIWTVPQQPNMGDLNLIGASQGTNDYMRAISGAGLNGIRLFTIDHNGNTSIAPVSANLTPSDVTFNNGTTTISSASSNFLPNNSSAAQNSSPYIGREISGSGITNGTYIASVIDANDAVLSAVTTATSSGETVTIYVPSLNVHSQSGAPQFQVNNNGDFFGFGTSNAVGPGAYANYNTTNLGILSTGTNNASMAITTKSDGGLQFIANGAHASTSIWTPNSSVLQLGTVNTAAITITTAQQVGIGTASPANLLDINGSADVQGNLAVGTTTTSTATLNVNGTEAISGLLAANGISNNGNVTTTNESVSSTLNFPLTNASGTQIYTLNNDTSGFLEVNETGTTPGNGSPQPYNIIEQNNNAATSSASNAEDTISQAINFPDGSRTFSDWTTEQYPPTFLSGWFETATGASGSSSQLYPFGLTFTPQGGGHHTVFQVTPVNATGTWNGATFALTGNTTVNGTMSEGSTTITGAASTTGNLAVGASETIASGLTIAGGGANITGNITATGTENLYSTGNGAMNTFRGSTSNYDTQCVGTGVTAWWCEQLNPNGTNNLQIVDSQDGGAALTANINGSTTIGNSGSGVGVILASAATASTTLTVNQTTTLPSVATNSILLTDGSHNVTAYGGTSCPAGEVPNSDSASGTFTGCLTPLTANQTITVTATGDATGTGSGSTSITIPLALKPSGVASGSYTNANITVSSSGIVTAASNGSAGGGGGVATSTPNTSGTLQMYSSSGSGKITDSVISQAGTSVTVNASATAYNGEYNSSYYQNATATTATTQINWKLGNVQGITIASNTQFSFTNSVAGGRYVLMILQDSTGGRLATWATSSPSINWPSSNAPVLSVASNTMDIMSFVCGPANCYGGYNYSYAP